MGKQKDYDWQAISIHTPTRQKLLTMCKKSETYDDFLNRLITLAERHKKEFDAIEVVQ